jgi:ubiquinone/menaquinone biosynthesis C-methylase UbiE
MVSANGRVLCIDVQPGMIAILCDRLAEAGVTNACPIVADATRLPLAENAIDRCFLVTVLGEIPDRPHALAEVHRVLRQGATLSVLESLGDPDYMLEPHTRDLARASGFEVQEHRPTRLGYTMTLGKATPAGV